MVSAHRLLEEFGLETVQGIELLFVYVTVSVATITGNNVCRSSPDFWFTE